MNGTRVVKTWFKIKGNHILEHEKMLFFAICAGILNLNFKETCS